MHVPQWLSFLIAGAVILFGFYRLWFAFGGPSDEERANVRRGMLAMPRRQHAGVGILYLLVGSALLLTAFGWNPFHRTPSAPIPMTSSPPAKAIPIAP
jgi:hypothetical protein